MIREELRQLPAGPRDLRKFGFTVGGVFLALAAWFLYRHKPVGPYFLTVGAVLVLLAAVGPQYLRRVYLGWMGMALVLGLCVSTIILTLFFFLVVTPVGLVARLTGKDFLSLRLHPQAASYWLGRPQGQSKKAEDYERQF